MIKVALILPSLRQTGPIILAYNLVSESSKHDVTFVVFYFDEIVELSFPCETRKIKFNEVPDFSGFDILHTHGLRPDLYYYLNKGRIKKPSISTVHQYIYDNLAYDYNRIIALLFTPIWETALKAQKAVVCINKDMRDRYLKKFSFSAVECIYNGVGVLNDRNLSQSDLELINQLKRQKEQGKTIVLSIAGLNRVKGLNQMFQVLKENENIVYVVVGEGPERKKFNLQIESNKLQDRFFMLGFKSNARAFLEFADVYLMPSRSEAFGLSLVEAAAESKPIVCSNIQTFKELFTEKEVVFFELDNTKSLLNAIAIAMANKDILGLMAHSKYTEAYTSRIMANNYLFLYNRLLSIQ